MLNTLACTYYIQGLSLKEFLKIKNIFIIIGQWLNENLKKNANNNLNLTYRSLIPILSKEAIKELLLQLTTEEKAQSFLDIISWSPQSERILDIQYNPFINMGDFYAMPLNILANSNSIRNLYALMHKSNELLSNGQDDPLIQIIKDAFNYSNKPCITNIKHSKGDIDIIAKIDNTLLVLECKNTLHPTSAHDMRTTWNHITKGQEQLRKIETAMSTATQTIIPNLNTEAFFAFEAEASVVSAWTSSLISGKASELSAEELLASALPIRSPLSSSFTDTPSSGRKKVIW